MTKKAVLGLVVTKNCCLSESSKFIVGLSYHLLLICNNSCHTATKLADLRGVLEPPEPPAGHAPDVITQSAQGTKGEICWPLLLQLVRSRAH